MTRARSISFGLRAKLPVLLLIPVAVVAVLAEEPVEAQVVAEPRSPQWYRSKTIFSGPFPGALLLNQQGVVH
ncbi:hypothetical protein D3C78_808950 [compost metagenome]